MNKLAILILAGSASMPAAALAQHAAPPPGVTWQQPVVQHHAPRVHVGSGERVMIHSNANRTIRRHHRINGYPHYRRVDRGFILPNHWWGPRFHVQNWGMYGFPQPMHGHRWVRYYDDALLIDGHGRVHDGRWGMNWDRYDDRWDYDDSGVPYYGDDDYYAEDDYGYEDDGAYAGHHVPPPPCAHGCTQPGYGYGYGYMHGGMVTVVETTVTVPQNASETVYIEEEVVREPRRHKPRRSYKHRPPPPQPGERG